MANRRDPLTPDDIRSALNNIDGWFANVACHDVFCMTELCSHVRFVMMERTGEPPERCLAWILRRNMRGYAENWIAESQKIEILELSQAELRDRLANELSAIPQSEHTQMPWLAPFSLDEISQAEQVKEIRGINPYDAGPTTMTLWWRTDRVFYLETHLES